MPVSPITDARSPLSYARRYAQRGLRVIPLWWAQAGADGRLHCACGTECKSPAKHPLHKLVRHGQDNGTTDIDQITTWWTAYPQANVGIVVASSGLVVIDIDPRNGGFETIAAIEAQHGPLQSDVMAFTGGGGEHRVFTIPAGQNLPGRLGPGVDVKLNGYIVAEPSNHISGGTYQWEASSDPLDGILPSPLPDWVRSIVPAAPAPAAAPVSTPIDAKTSRDLQSALVFFDADSYHDWIIVGLSIHAADAGKAGLSEWTKWAAQSPKYDPAASAAKWASFRDDKGLDNRGLSSIFAEAPKRGWINPARKDAQFSPEELAAAQVQPAPITLTDTPLRFRAFPVDVLNDIWRWVSSSYDKSHPLASQAVALAIASATVSRRYVTQYGDPLHMYLGILVPTASAARYAMTAAERIMFDAGFGASIRASRMSSPQHLYGTLNRSPSILYCADDYGDQLRFAKRQPSGLLEQTLSLIAGRVYNGSTITLDNWAEIGMKQPPGAPAQPVLHSPCVTLLAIIAGSQLGNTFRRSELSRGALDSMIFVPALRDEDWIDRPAANVAPIPDAVLTVLRAARQFQSGQTAETQDQMFSRMAAIAPTPIVVRFNGDIQSAERALMARFPRQVQHIRILIDGARRNLRRIAATLAAIAAPAAPIVTDEMLSWSMEFVTSCLQATVDEYELMGGDDEKPDVYQTVLEFIYRQGIDGSTERDIVKYVRAFRAITVKEKRDDLLGGLETDGMVVRIKTAKSHKFVHASFTTADVPTQVPTGGVGT